MLPKTIRGYDFGEVTSAMQKAIRRGDAKTAGYFAIELFESGYAQYVFRRLLTISAEDCYGMITKEIWAIYEAWKEINAKKKGAGRIFVAKAVILLSLAKKSRDADHLTNIVYDKLNISDKDVSDMLSSVRGEKLDIPVYSYDCHTAKGKAIGMTKEEFFKDEFNALKPRQAGLFDNLI